MTLSADPNALFEPGPLHPQYQTLNCPVTSCTLGYTHIQSVDVLAREEDQPGNSIRVDVTTGAVQPHRDQDPAANPQLGNRRHRVVLNVTCEAGHSFSVIFNQHKGVTMIDAVVHDE